MEDRFVTKPRVTGTDCKATDYIRNHPRLGSGIHQAAFTCNDIDLLVLKYACPVWTPERVLKPFRSIKKQMIVEIKALYRQPDSSQLETLLIRHQQCKMRYRKLRMPNGRTSYVTDYGVYVLLMGGVGITDSEKLFWGVFNDDLHLQYYELESPEHVIDLLNFEKRPDKPDQRDDKQLCVWENVFYERQGDHWIPLDTLSA